MLQNIHRLLFIVHRLQFTAYYILSACFETHVQLSLIHIYTAGINSGFPDEAYQAVGAHVLPTIEDIYATAETVSYTHLMPSAFGAHVSFIFD